MKPTLPIDSFIPEIIQSIQQNSSTLLSAAPGSGKTTRLPPALVPHFKGKILVLEPRRIAAISAAHRIASENNWKMGTTVGFQVRFQSLITNTTNLIFMTEALLTKKLLHDPELSDVDLVILDEFHERSIHVDLALSFIKEMQELGSKIKLVIMSATLNKKDLIDFLPGISVFDLPGQVQKINYFYSKKSQVISIQHSFFENIVHSIKNAVRHTQRNILVFLPGIGEIRRVQQQLNPWATEHSIEVHTLHGSLSLEEQSKVLQSKPIQKIILSTNIAESSVTVDGVDTVIDSGLAKMTRFDPKLGASILEVKRISRSSAHQRAGRSARQYEGQCYRLWSQHDELSMSDFEIPEVQRSDISNSLLVLSSMGIRDFKNFSWFEAPPESLLNYSIEYLKMIKAISSDHQITSMGQRLLQLPLDLNLSRCLIEAKDLGQAPLGALIAAALEKKQLLGSPKSEYTSSTECDVQNLIYDSLMGSNSSQFIEIANHLLRSTGETVQISPSLVKDLEISPPLMAQILLSGFARRLCHRRKESDRGLMVGGKGVKLAQHSHVKKSEFFMALSIIDTGSSSEISISMASSIEKKDIENLLSDFITKKSEIFYDSSRGTFYRKEYRQVFDLPLDEGNMTLLSEIELKPFLAEVFRNQFADVLKNNEPLRLFWKRLDYLKSKISILPVPIQNSIHSFFNQEYGGWFELSCSSCTYGETNFFNIMKKDLIPHFKTNLPKIIQDYLDNELPHHIKVPSGSLIPVQYELGKDPFLEVRIQEIFGWKKAPLLLNNQLPLSLHLLGPNFRPVQITNHLENFWKETYSEVRKELKTRYPKHQWPEDPNLGIPEAKGRRRQ